MDNITTTSARTLIDFARERAEEVFGTDDASAYDNINEVYREANKLEHFIDCNEVEDPNYDPEDEKYKCPHSCPRCILPFASDESRDGTTIDEAGTFEWSWCHECHVCANCEHMNDCSFTG